MKKLPNSVSTEDLLKALETTTEASKPIDEIFDFHNDVPLFLSKYDIQSGPNQVSKISLYSLYVRYSNAPIPKRDFLLSVGAFVAGYSLTSFALNKTKIEIRSLIQKEGPVNNKYSMTGVATRKHFELFLSENNIRSGKKWVESFVLVYIYQRWCRNNRKLIRFKPNNFVKVAKLFLEHRKTTYINNWFKVDESLLLTLTEEDKGKIQDEARKRQEARQKTKTKR